MNERIENDPKTLRWWCQQLLDIIDNYNISHEVSDDEIDILNDIRAAVDPAYSSNSTPSRSAIPSDPAAAFAEWLNAGTQFAMDAGHVIDVRVTTKDGNKLRLTSGAVSTPS